MQKKKLKHVVNRKWKTISYAPRYQISNDGRVRELSAPPGVFLEVRFTTKGRPRYALGLHGGRLTIEAHFLVAHAFLPPMPPNKPWILHGDDDPLNCTDKNLRWGDHWDNVADWQKNRKNRPGYVPPKSFKTSRARSGPVAPSRKKKKYRLTSTEVSEIMKDTRFHKDIAAQYGVSRVQVTRIKNGLCWRSLPSRGVDSAKL